jgi:hypothetical protein
MTVFGSASPAASPVAVDEHNAAQHSPVVHFGLAVALGEERSQSLHLIVRQPKKVAYSRLLAKPESDRDAHINGSCL